MTPSVTTGWWLPDRTTYEYEQHLTASERKHREHQKNVTVSPISALVTPTVPLRYCEPCDCRALGSMTGKVVHREPDFYESQRESGQAQQLALDDAGSLRLAKGRAWVSARLLWATSQPLPDWANIAFGYRARVRRARRACSAGARSRKGHARRENACVPRGFKKLYI